MQVLSTHGAGLAGHKKTVVACLITPALQGGWQHETRPFGTMTRDWLALSDWWLPAGGPPGALESTGEYWNPVFNILAAHLAVRLVKAQHRQAVPGRKTEVKEAQGLAELLQHGLLRASFLPPPAQRELRELTRHRSPVVRAGAPLVNRVQQVWESANIQLASVATEGLGVAGRAILQALTVGESAPGARAELAKGGWRTKGEQVSQALEGRGQAAPRFVLTELLGQIDSREDPLGRVNEQLEAYRAPFAAAVELLATSPGGGQETAEVSVAEMGADLSRFPTARHLAAWAGVAPGKPESAGKRRTGRTRTGNQALRQGLSQAAPAAAHTRHPYVAAPYHRLAARRGSTRAVVAIAHSILGIASYLLSRQEPYREWGGDYCDRLRPETTAQRLLRRLENLGYQITLQAPAQEALASG